jgi:hypothetical protein
LKNLAIAKTTPCEAVADEPGVTHVQAVHVEGLLVLRAHAESIEDRLR